MYKSKKVYISPFGREFELPTIEQVIALIAKPNDKVDFVGEYINEEGIIDFKLLNDMPILFTDHGCAVDTADILEELRASGVRLDTPVKHISSLPYNDGSYYALYVDLD